ncbi:MAG: hypothetical protein JWO81_2622 [Alphaproteobacteria bacterium]|nr:hypothetical protein [Alphaproteobacteria bacterium]
MNGQNCLIALSMWGFRKKPVSRADAAMAVMPDAIAFAAEKWLFFSERLVFKAEVPLADRIASFMVPAEQGIENKFPALRNAPGGLVVMIIAMGIVESGVHSRNEVEEALGVQLPER